MLLPTSSSHLVHDEDEQRQQQQAGQNRQSHDPAGDLLGGVGHPHDRHAHLRTHASFTSTAVTTGSQRYRDADWLAVSCHGLARETSVRSSWRDRLRLAEALKPEGKEAERRTRCVPHRGAVGRELRHQVFVRHLDDAEGGRGVDHVGPVLVLRLKGERTRERTQEAISSEQEVMSQTFRKVSTARRE